MKKSLTIFFSLLVTLTCFGRENLRQTAEGASFQSQGMDVKISFYSPEIVRVSRTIAGMTSHKPDLVVLRDAEKVDFTLEKTGDGFIMKSSSLTLTVDTVTGAVVFSTPDGKEIVAEKPYGTTFSDTNDGYGNYNIRQTFRLNGDQAIYGLGQQQTGLMDQSNQILDLVQRNSKVCIPIIQSTKGYGIYWDQYSKAEFEHGPQGMTMKSFGDCADYYFMYSGNIKSNIKLYRELTGDVPMFPLWSYGFIQSRERYKNQQEPVDVVAKYRKLGVPLDCIVQDWQYWGLNSHWNAMDFDKERYPEPQKMLDAVHKMNAKMMIVVWPGFGHLTPQSSAFGEKGFLLDMETYPFQNIKPYDAYNPAARDLYWSFMKKNLVRMGFDAWWMDATEPDLTDSDKNNNVKTHFGPYKSVYNAYPLTTVSGVYTHQRAEDDSKRVFILTRSGFAGQQHYGANVWSGDIQSTFPTLAKQIPAALNFSMSGLPYWNADIGGFWGNCTDADFPELYTRWMQFGTFTPMMRSHGTGKVREIFNFGKRGDRIFNVQEKFIRLRYALLPYNYSTAWGVTHRHETFMKPLAVDFPEDRNVYDMGTEYMYGDAFLVAPVTEKGQEVKDIYLPEGTLWYDFWTDETFNGGQTVSRETPIEILPLYVKAGSILPFGPDVQYAEEKSWRSLELKVYPGSDGSFILYEDANDSYDYEKGKYTEIELNWDNATRTLTVQNRKGGFDGMIVRRKFNINVIGMGTKTITYTGNTVAVKF